MPLGEAHALIVHHQGAVIILGFRSTKRAEEQDLSEGGFDQISTADHFSDVHVCIVHCTRELVAGQIVFSPNKEISKIPAGHGALLAHVRIDKSYLTIVEYAKSPVGGNPIAQRGKGCIGRGTECLRINGFVIVAAFVWSANRVQHIASRARTRENQSGRMKFFQCAPIVRPALALVVRSEGAAHIRALCPAQSEPTEVLQHGIDEIQAEANGIQIIITQNQFASGCAGAFSRNPKCARMTEVEMSSW